MIRTIIIFISITDLLAKKYLIELHDEEGGTEVAEEEGGEEGSDYSLHKGLEMKQDGQDYYNYYYYYY